MSKLDVLIIGAGPAGLGAAYELTKHRVACRILEAQAYIGGHAKTVEFKGYHFDIGGHRFFSKSAEINQLWREVLAEDFIRTPRLSRIYYNGRFFNYPLKPMNALLGLGIGTSIEVMASYLKAVLTPNKDDRTYEQWVSNRFGRKLYEVFFKNYTEKVWGIPCHEIEAEWAAQRIQGLSLFTAAKNALFPQRNGSIKTLIEEFDYPRLGPGMMYQRMRDRIVAGGAEVENRQEVTAVHRDGTRVTRVSVRGPDGVTRDLDATHFISSMPITDLVKRLVPAAPDEVLRAAGSLRYRDFLSVNLIIDRGELFPDNWIYVHEPQVRLGRVQNYKNWSRHMVADPSKTALGLEYFCFEGEPFWTKPDAELVTLGGEEIERIGLASRHDVLDGQVVRERKAYPIYDRDYRRHLDVIRAYLATFENLQTVGRYGLFRYNNMDHALLTGLYGARNVLAGSIEHSVWDVNADADYLESDRKPSTRGIPLEQVR